MQSTVLEGDLNPEVIITISTADSHLHYWDTTNNMKGQRLIFLQIEIMVIHITVLLVNIIHLELLGIPLTQITIR